MPRELTFYGASDDLFEIEGTHGYEPAEAGWLCAIQQRFAELFHQQTNGGAYAK